MATDALNPLRSLYIPVARAAENRFAEQAGKGFTDVLASEKSEKVALPIIDGMPVEPNPNIKQRDISDKPVVPDNQDPQLLLTHKLAASLLGLQNWHISDKPVVPVA